MEKKKISDLVNVHNNKRVPLSANQRANLEKIYPYYGAQGIVDYVDNFIFSGKYILVAEDGENLRSNKQNICNLVEGEFWVNNHAHILTANDENITDYLYYNFNQIKFEPYITGSAQPKLNKENLLNIKTFVHSKEEQQKIAHTLSILDRKIALNRQINAKLEAMAKTLYDYWFVQFDFPNSEGKPYRSSGGEMVWCDELKREVPKGWEVKKIKDIARTGSGGTPKSTINEYYKNGDIPWINSGELNNPFIVSTENYISQLGLENSSAKLFPANSILMAMYGATAGKTSLISFEATTNQAICAIIPNDKRLNFYLKIALSDLYQYLVNLSSGSARDNLSQDKIKDLYVVVPCEEMIKKYAQYTVKFYEKMKTTLEQTQKLTQLRDFLLPMLMNGQVGVM